jgi:hypothetical protein
MSHRFIAALATVALAAGATSAFADDGHGHGRDDGDHHGNHHGKRHGGKALEAALFGSQPTGPTLFGVKPGGAPWVIRSGKAEVRREGRVEVRVRGLVIPTAPQNGTNPLPGIAATVFCGGTAVGTTKTVPFSPAGDARIEDRLGAALPSPCLVPAVLLNPQIGSAVNPAVYIAATGVR